MNSPWCCTGKSQLDGNVRPNNNDSIRLLTSGPPPVCSERRPLLRCFPSLLVSSGTVAALCPRARLNWSPHPSPPGERRCAQSAVVRGGGGEWGGWGGLGEEPRPPKLSRQFHVLPQGRAAGETRARERERDGSKNGLPLPNTMRGIEERE